MFFKLALLASIIPAAFAIIHGIDISQLLSTSNFVTFKNEGFVKVVIRGFENACSGGQVDPNFVGSYNNARAAGITNIDTYWSPCTGTGNACKSYAEQITEIGSTIVANRMQIGKIWIVIETDSTCNTWNYGTAGNLDQAKSLITAAKASGFVFGIFSSPGEWASIFASDDVALDPSLPLWLDSSDNNDFNLTLSQPFGGWTSAFGKRYIDPASSGFFNLDIFTA